MKRNSKSKANKQLKLHKKDLNEDRSDEEDLCEVVDRQNTKTETYDFVTSSSEEEGGPERE